MIPSAMVATPIRSAVKLDRADSRPSPLRPSSDSPSSRSRPRRTSSKNSSPVGELCKPIFFSGALCVRPGMPLSRTNVSTLRSRGLTFRSPSSSLA